MIDFGGWDIIDCNTFTGHWPFRRLRHNDTAGLLSMMDKFGVDKACVASASAILYKDCQAGNEELFEATHVAPGRFRLYATLNPAYAGWERDLHDCAEMGFMALRLYPYYHGYKLDDDRAGEIIEAATALGMPVSIPCRVVDVRQRHWMDTNENLTPEAIVQAAENHPDGVFIMSEAIVNAPAEGPLWRRLQNCNVYIEMSRMTSVLDKNIKTAVEKIGADRLLFGTGFPFKSPSPAYLKIAVLDIDEAQKRQIMAGNTSRLFT